MIEAVGRPKLNDETLKPSERELLRFARQIGVTGALCLIMGGTGLIATADQTSWNILRSFYLSLVVLGPVGIFIARKILRILMKHTHKEFSILDG